MAHISFNSIRFRLILASLVFLPLFCGLLAWSLDQAFQASLTKNMEEKLQLQVYNLIAEADYDEARLFFPDNFSQERLNQPSSGLFSLAHRRESDELFWQSASALGVDGLNSWQPLASDLGQLLFTSSPLLGQDYFIMQYAFAWESDQALDEFVLTVFERTSGLEAQVSAYRQNLWTWLLIIAVAILAIQLLILKWGLRPILSVVTDLRLMREGKKNQLEGNYPKELRGLTSSINELVRQEQEQKKRYRNTMSDLAHSIKTPLAVLQGEVNSDPCDRSTLLEQTQRIDEIVTYQLNRSVIGGKGVFSEAHEVLACVEELVSAVSRVYADKNMSVETDIDDGVVFLGEKGDLMEVLGNILENAFKYGTSKVHVLAANNPDKGLVLEIEDDGAGVEQDKRITILQRGERADTSVSGQGLGLSIVGDIVSSYKGSIELFSGSLGGLGLRITL